MRRLILLTGTVALATAGTVGGLIVTDAISAPPESSSRPATPVLEQNLDEAFDPAAIRVHEQGVAKVDVQNTDLDVEVEFPATQDVRVTNTIVSPVPTVAAPANTSVSVDETLDAGDGRTVSLGSTIEASLINLNNFNNDEYTVSFEFGEEQRWFTWSDFDGNTEQEAIPLSQPIPISQVRIRCHNEFDSCVIHLDVVGRVRGLNP